MRATVLFAALAASVVSAQVTIADLPGSSPSLGLLIPTS